MIAHLINQIKTDVFSVLFAKEIFTIWKFNAASLIYTNTNNNYCIKIKKSEIGEYYMDISLLAFVNFYMQIL